MKVNEPKHKFNNVLMIDDNPLDNFINEKMMEATQFSKHIHKSTTGAGALAFINQVIRTAGTGDHAIPDFIFVDLNMPEMDGFEFIDRFKQLDNADLKTCRIIILTSSISSDDRTRAMGLDPDIVFINKPLTTEFLNSIQPNTLTPILYNRSA